MKIAGRDLSNFSILGADGQTNGTAAEELVYYLKKYCGYFAPDPSATTGTVYVGFSEMEEFSLQEDELENDDSFVIRTVGGNLYICGKTPVGTLYGVYHFLNMLGIDWLTPEQEIAEVNNNLDVQCNTVYNFTSAIRQAHGYSTVYADDKFFVRQRMIRTVGETNNRPFFGGIRGLEYAFSWGMFGHTFEWLIPYDEYFEKHPEYFSFAKGHYGEKGKNQICLTNPEVTEIVKRKVLDYLEKHPDCKIVSVSQNDAYEDFVDNLCMCESCKKIYEREGNRYSGVLIDFVNRIADAVAEKYPNVLIHTFAYKQTTIPPLHVKPRDNVMVQVCLSHKPHVSMLSEEEDCVRVKNQFDDWRKVAKNLHVWTYLVNHSFYFAPIANFESLFEDTTYMLKEGAYGIFQQENGDDFPFEFSDLRIYLIAKLFQDPYMSKETYIGYMKKFLRGFYGKQSAPYIFEYLEVLEKLYAENGKQKELSQNGYAMLQNDDAVFANESFISRGKELWKNALMSAENELYKKRIENSKKSFDYAELVYLYANIKSEQDAIAYADKKEKLYRYAYKHRGFLIYGETWGRRVYDLSHVDWKAPPRILRNVDKTIRLRGDERSCMQDSDANTDEKVKDFSFRFDVKNTGEALDFRIEVTDKDPTHTKENIDDWEQDGVELFFSERFHKGNVISEGDFRLHINARGVWTANGKEDRVKVSFERTESGYALNVAVAFRKEKLCAGEKMGFELIAHNIGENGYRNTVYWNSAKRAIMDHYPSLCGKIEFI